MKILRIGLVLTFLLSTLSAGAMAADMKYGYVDLSRLFDEYHKTKEFDKELEGKSKLFEDERNGKIEKIREEQGKLALLAEDKRTQKEQEIETLKADLLEFDRQKKADLTKERNEIIREILLEIEKEVSDYAKENKYDLILNDRVLIYGKEDVNLTEDILKILNDK